MDGKPLGYFPDEIRVRVGGNCLLSAPFARGPTRAPSPSVTTGRRAPDVRALWAQMLVKPKIQGEES